MSEDAGEDIAEPIAMEAGSGNVFEDLGLEDAPELRLKAAILGQINSILRHRHLTQAQAAEVLGVSQPKVSALRNGKLHGFSLGKLLDFMVRLDREVEIGFTKVSAPRKPRYLLRTEKGTVPVAA